MLRWLADLASTSARTTTAAVAALDPKVTGERQLVARNGWYRRAAKPNANLMRRRGSSGEEVRVLSNGHSGDAPATRRGAGGSYGDDDPDGVLLDDAAAMAAAQPKKNQRR